MGDGVESVPRRRPGSAPRAGPPARAHARRAPRPADDETGSGVARPSRGEGRRSHRSTLDKCTGRRDDSSHPVLSRPRSAPDARSTRRLDALGAPSSLTRRDVLLAGAGAAAAFGALPRVADAALRSTLATPKRGGTLRVGIAGGSPQRQLRRRARSTARRRRPAGRCSTRRPCGSTASSASTPWLAESLDAEHDGRPLDAPPAPGPRVPQRQDGHARGRPLLARSASSTRSRAPPRPRSSAPSTWRARRSSTSAPSRSRSSARTRSSTRC